MSKSIKTQNVDYGYHYLVSFLDFSHILKGFFDQFVFPLKLLCLSSRNSWQFNVQLIEIEEGKKVIFSYFHLFSICVYVWIFICAQMWVCVLLLIVNFITICFVSVTIVWTIYVSKWWMSNNVLCWYVNVMRKKFFLCSLSLSLSKPTNFTDIMCIIGKTKKKSEIWQCFLDRYE